MAQLMNLRDTVILFYKKYETPLTYAFKFILGLIIFTSINHYFASLGNYCTQIDRFVFVLLAAILTAVMPTAWVFVLMWAFVSLHFFFFSLELSIIVSLALLCAIFFYVRVFPKESWLIVLLMFCYFLKIPYLVPLVAGLFMGIGSIGALIIAPIISCFMTHVEEFKTLGSHLDNLNVLSLPQTFGDTFKHFVEVMTTDTTWIYSAIVFIAAMILVHLISKLPFNYSMEAAIGVGALVLIGGMLFGAMSGGVSYSPVGIFVGCAVSALLAFVCKLFYIIVDYTSTEKVTFEDEDYLYYVKAVPKLRGTKQIEEAS